MTDRFGFRLVLVGVLTAALVACGGGSSKPPATSPSPPAVAAISITSIQMSTQVAKDGSAAAPSTVFDSTKDKQIVAVLGLADLAAGTKISYTRYLDGKYVNSKSAVLKKRSKFLHFTFTPKADKTFKPGSYRLKFYVNEKSAGEITYTIK